MMGNPNVCDEKNEWSIIHEIWKLFQFGEMWKI